jgi:glycosyltransferase involved in cell wall biosynthesis
LSLFQIDAGMEWRGGQRQALFLARELKKRGFRFTLVAQPDGPLRQKAADEGLPVLPLRMKSEMDVLASLRLAGAMKREGCRLAHFHDAHAVAVGGRAAQRARVPIRIISRRVDFPLKRNPFSRNKYTKNADLIIAISEGVKDVLIKGGTAPAAIEVIPSGIDFSPFDAVKERGLLRQEFHFAPEDFLVGIVAALEDHKGHTDLLEAARLIKLRAPKVKIVIVGSGSLDMELDQQARDLHVDDLVFFLGFREDVPRILASLDLFVLSSRLEGLGSSIMDAMASRLPVVATQVGGIPEVVIHRETGLLVPPKSPQALAQAILKLYLDKALAGRLAQRGFEVVHERFSAEAMAARIILIYERIASGKGVRLGGQSPHP